MKTRRFGLAHTSGALLLLFGFMSAAGAQTMTATWFTVSSGDPDRPFPFTNGAVDPNEVLSALGPDGLPEYNSSYGGPAIQDLYTHGGVSEITWWSPAHDANVTETGTSSVTLPLNFPCTTASNCLYPANGKGSSDGGSAGYQAAIFSATLTPKTSESVSFSIGADDVAFAYLNGQVICDLGGVHPDSPGTCTTGLLNAGTANTLEVFYADLRPSAAAFSFSIETTNVGVCSSNCGTTTPPGGGTSVPEPATFGLMGLGFAVLGFARRRRAALQGG
jgi:fibro-slime domain-containing protein